MNLIQNIDWYILLFINSSHTAFFDFFFSTISRKDIWIPLYVLLAIIFFRKLGFKNGIILIIAAIICFGLTDSLSSHVIKPFFHRLRPCHTEMGQISLWIPGKCGGQYGFISSHAANTMGIAVFCILVFTRKIKGNMAGPISILLLAYAFLNSLSRVYLGVHYPTDVIAGAAFGASIAFALFWVANKFTNIHHSPYLNRKE